jgi:hypothetical protein
MRKYMIAGLLVVMFMFTTAISFATTDPAVTIVNPTINSTIYSTNLLISVKVTQPKVIRIKVTEEKKVINDNYYSTTIEEIQKADLAREAGKPAATFVSVPVEGSDTYVSQNYLNFYTKRIEKVMPGTYKIKVDTILNDKVVFSSESLVMMKEKPVEVADVKIFSTVQSGATQFLQNLLKSIFGN